LGKVDGEPTLRERERAAMDTEVDRAMVPFRIAFRVGIGAVTVLTLAGLAWATVRWLNRRVDTVYPDRSGLYPIREQRVGRTKVFHDPNRALTGATVYAVGDHRISVDHPLALGQEDAQQQVTGQAQAAQALRAAVSGVSPLRPAQMPVIDALTPQRVSRALPEVKVLDLEPSHIERLLLEKEVGSVEAAEWEST
jgi:hypothetical protein